MREAAALLKGGWLAGAGAGAGVGAGIGAGLRAGDAGGAGLGEGLSEGEEGRGWREVRRTTHHDYVE